MKKIALAFILASLSFQSFACFELKNIKLKNHLLIKGMSVNHRFIFLDEKGNTISDLGNTNVTDLSGKENRKQVVSFANGFLSLVPDQFPKDGVIRIEFMTLKKEIRIEIDKTKAAAKSLTRSSGGCGGKLEFKTY